MPHIDDEFIDDARAGQFPVNDFLSYLNEDGNEDIRAHVEEGLENGLSMEWAAMVCDADVSPDIESWDHVTIMRDADGEWAVAITDGDGETKTFGFTDEEAAQDLIWADMYFHLQEYGVEFDKEIDSGAASE